MNWLPYHPDGLSQVLYNETNACSNYAPIDSIETHEFFFTGQKVQYSRRWLALMSGTDKNGNYIGTPPPGYIGNNKGSLPTLQKNGLVLESSWPQSPNMTWDQYYAPPTPAQQAALEFEGQQWLKKWSVACTYNLPASQLSNLLITAPLLARVKEGGTEHFIAVLNENTMFDSEPHTNNPQTTFIQPLPPVEALYQIIIKRKEQSMNLVNSNGTYFVEGDKGYLGINHVDFLNELLKITDQVESRSPVGTQLGIIETGPTGFIIKSN